MTVRDVEGKLPYTGGKAISIDENKVISLNLRDENNLIIYDEGDDEIYVDLQLPDGIRPLDAFPVGVTTGRVLVADDWDTTGTIVCFKTTSGDNIKLLYADDGKLYIDNGTGTFKQIYLKGEVDALLQALREYIDAQLALKQDKLTAGNGISIDNNNEISNTLPGPIVSSSAPLDPAEGDQWYDTTNDVLKIYDGTNWNEVGSGSADVNTKTFTLSGVGSSAAVLEEAQEIYDFYLNGGNPLIKYQDNLAGFQMIYSVYDKNQWSLFFVGNSPVGNLDASTTYVDVYQITLSLDSDTVTNVLMSPSSYTGGYLGTDTDYPTPYTPLYNGSPATKKYVDDSVDVKVFDLADLTSAASLATATQAYTYAYTNGKCAIIRYSNGLYVYSYGSASTAYFSRSYGNGAVTGGVSYEIWSRVDTLQLTVSSGSVTAIAQNKNQINISTIAPSSTTSNNTITLVI